MKSFIQRKHTLVFAASLILLVTTVSAFAEEASSWTNDRNRYGQSIDPNENLRQWLASQGQRGFGVPGPAMPPWPSQFVGHDIQYGAMYQDQRGHIMTNYVNHATQKSYRTIDTYQVPGASIFQIYRNDTNENGYPTSIALYVNGHPSETVESTQYEGYYDKITFHDGNVLSIAQLAERMRLSFQNSENVKARGDSLASRHAYQQYEWSKFTYEVVASKGRR